MGELAAALQIFLVEWAGAERRGDVTSLRALLSDDFLAVQADGGIVRKTEWLQRYQRAVLVHEALSFSTQLRVTSAHVGVMVGSLRQVSSFEGRGVSKRHHVMMVIDLDQRPQLLALHFAETGS